LTRSSEPFLHLGAARDDGTGALAVDIPKYLQILWSYRLLLVVGAVIAAIAAVLAGFRVETGELTPRVEQVYRATTTVLVSSPMQSIYEAEVPGQLITDGETAPQSRDLTQTAVVFAYLVVGNDIRSRVEAELGALTTDESISAVRRTTQPAGDESSPGRFSLPILDIVGVSGDPERAEDISRTTTEVFQAYVADQQATEGIPQNSRVILQTTLEAPAKDVTGSNSAIPLVVTGLGVFLLFVVLAFVLDNIRTRRAAARPAHAAAVGGPDPDDTPATAAWSDVDDRVLEQNALARSEP